jgi:hypothetical protein
MRAPHGPPPAAPPPPANRYGWWIGILAVIIMAYILVNTLRTEGPGSGGPAEGKALPPFATPLVLSDLEGDANVATKAGQGGAGEVPACTVRRPDVLNSCALTEGGPVVIGFLFTRGAECTGSFDTMQTLSAANPGVRFAGVIVRGDRDDARQLIRKQGWTFPVGFDQDGGVANVYGIAGCPEVVLAYPGGKVRETVAGRDRAERQLTEHVAALVAAARKRGWTPG